MSRLVEAGLMKPDLDQRFTYLNGDFCNIEGIKTPLEEIPPNAVIIFYDSRTADQLPVMAQHVQEPQQLLFLSEESPYSEPQPGDEEVRQHFRELYAFVTDELKRRGKP